MSIAGSSRNVQARLGVACQQHPSHWLALGLVREMICHNAAQLDLIESCLDCRERQDVQAWLGAACQQHPSHWLALRLASASKALPSLPTAAAPPPPPQAPLAWRRPLSDACAPLHEESVPAGAAWQVRLFDGHKQIKGFRCLLSIPPLVLVFSP